MFIIFEKNVDKYGLLKPFSRIPMYVQIHNNTIFEYRYYYVRVYYVLCPITYRTRIHNLSFLHFN